MVGDGDVFVAQRARRVGHVLDRPLPVGGARVHLEVTADVLHLHEMRKPVLAGERDLAAGFAELGGNPVEAELRVDLLLGFAGGPTCALEEAVLVQLVALLLGDFAEVDVVRFGAGEVQERRAVGVGLHRPQVHLEAAPELHGGAGLALRDDVRHVAVRDEPVHDRGAALPLRGHDNVQVPDRLASPAVAPGDFHVADASTGLEIRDYRGRLGFGFVEEHAPLPDLRLADPGPHFFFHLRPEPLELLDFAFVERGRAVGRRFHLELFVEQLHALGPEPGNAQQVQQSRGQLARELFAERQLTGGDDGRDLLGQVVADAGDVGQVFGPGAHQIGDRLGEIPNGAGGVAVGAHPERIRVLDLLYGQGVTTAAMSGVVSDQNGAPLADANVVAVHVPSGTQYRAVTRAGGTYNVPNMRVGGPYRVTATRIGYRSHTEADVFLSLGQDLRVDFRLEAQAVELAPVVATAERDEVLNPGRTGAATFIDPGKVELLPSIKRSTRDLIRTDPRNDGNYSFAGRNWLYNNISLDGSYFNNPFGLDDPAPGGQTNAEPVPYDAIEQMQVSVAPFDVRQGGFTGANVNSVTKSGTNEYQASAYTFGRNDALLGNTVRGSQVTANPDFGFFQGGASVSGPLVRDKLFFFVNAEIERSHQPGSDFVACTTTCTAPLPLGVSRVSAVLMDSIRTVMKTVYGYDTGPYEGYLHHTDNDKLIAKLDWNVNPSNTLSIRWDYLNAKRDLPPHPFVLSFNNTGRGPDATSLPFQNSGYAINNHLNSFALELNSRSRGFANRFFASYNRFRDFRQPFSTPFPTIEIGDTGVTYTTVGHEPFSIHNILDQDVWQFTDNYSWFRGKHVVTLGANFEVFSFFNSFNIFRDGVFFLPPPGGPGQFGGTTFSSLDQFFRRTDPNAPFAADSFIDFNAFIGTGPYKGENISIGQLGVYLQDEY